MLKAVIFDFDGVIVDSEPLHYMGFKEVLKAYGVDLTEGSYYSEYLGFGDIDCAKAFSRDFDLQLDAAGREKLVQQKTKVFCRLAEEKPPVIAGAGECVEMLRATDVHIAICSGAARADVDLLLQGTGMEDAFECIVSEDDIKVSKPDPEGFCVTLKRLNEISTDAIAPAECVVIEDSPWGLDAAIGAGMKTVAVTHTYGAEQLRDRASIVVDRLDKLTMDDLQGLCRQG